MRSVVYAALALLPLASGCGIRPGDYQIYRVAYHEAEASDDCFPNGQDPSDSEDHSTFHAGDTFAIFESGGELFLDTESFLIEGEKAEGVFTFTGEDVDVEFFTDTDFTTNTQTVEITLNDLGPSVDGTAVESVEQVCNGAGCDTFDSFSCSQTSSFVGTRVKGVDLEHQL